LTRGRLLDRLTAPLVHFMERFYPDVFLFIITIITFLSASLATDYPLRSMLLSWGNSMSSILSFSMQMVIIVLFRGFFQRTHLFYPGRWA
jgi:short-chain fatty acids transporter